MGQVIRRSNKSVSILVMGLLRLCSMLVFKVIILRQFHLCVQCIFIISPSPHYPLTPSHSLEAPFLT